MRMIHRLYELLHRAASRPDERRQYSAGFWPDKIRRYAAEMCRQYSGRLLEFGCGEGLFLMSLKKSNPSVELWGVDIWGEILIKAKDAFDKAGIKDIRLIHSQGERLPFEDDFFDHVVCINVFLNMGSLAGVEAAAREMARVLKKDGSLVIEFRNRMNPFVFLKYRLADYYDATVRKQALALTTFTIWEILGLFKALKCSVNKREFIGFPYNSFAPIVIMEIKKS